MCSSFGAVRRDLILHPEIETTFQDMVLSGLRRWQWHPNHQNPLNAGRPNDGSRARREYRRARPRSPKRPGRMGLTVAEVEDWREKFLLGAENALEADPRDEEAVKRRADQEAQTENRGSGPRQRYFTGGLETYPLDRKTSDA